MLEVKDVLLREDVHIASQPSLLHDREHLSYDEVDIPIRVTLILGSNVMSTEVSTDDIDRLHLIQPLSHLELTELCLLIETIAALSLHRGDTHTEHGAKVKQCRLCQLLCRSLSSGRGGGCDATTLLHYAHIALACETPLKLILTEASED